MTTTPSPFTLRLFEPDIGSEERQAVLQVIDSGMLSMGAMVEAFEDAFARFLGIRHGLVLPLGDRHDLNRGKS